MESRIFANISRNNLDLHIVAARISTPFEDLLLLACNEQLISSPIVNF
jgi:hypothetical protein